MTATEFLDARAGFELAAFFVSWVAIAFLAVIATSLHLRVARLEQAVAVTERRAPFAGVLGRPLGDHLPHPIPRLVLMVGSSCDACRSLLDDLAAVDWDISTVVAWKDHSGTKPATFPASVRHWRGGRDLAAAIGVDAEPLALVLDRNGRVVAAQPTSSLSTIRDLVRRWETQNIERGVRTEVTP